MIIRRRDDFFVSPNFAYVSQSPNDFLKGQAKEAAASL